MIANLINLTTISKMLKVLNIMYFLFVENTKTNHSANNHLKTLNEKTKSLKSDLGSLKKLQENLNSSFGNSMKNFVQQLNVIFLTDNRILLIISLCVLELIIAFFFVYKGKVEIVLPKRN